MHAMIDIPTADCPAMVSLSGMLLGRPPSKVAGALLLIVGVVAFMGIITAEATYPGYSTSDNMISDLGGTEPPNSVIRQPAATIFNTTMIISGIMIIISALLLRRDLMDRTFTAVLGVFGVGVLGVGIFNGSYGDIHGIFALITFVAGALAAMLAFRVVGCPFKFISLVLGAISISTLILYYILGDPAFEAIGSGGVERWIAYPVLLWVLGLGGYLLGSGASCSLPNRGG